MKSNPLVSVVLTTFNRKEDLTTAINSVINQSYNNIELIIVDDCSNYDVEEKISICDYDLEMKILVNEKNRGANWSRCRGITESRGTYIAFLDDDDIWKAQKVEKQIECLKNSPESVKLCCTGYEKNNNKFVLKLENRDKLQKCLLKGNNPIGGFSVFMIEKSIINDVGLPDINLPFSQDLDWYIRLLQNHDICVIEDTLVNYSTEGDRITNNKINDNIWVNKYLINKHEIIIREYGEDFLNEVKSDRAYNIAINYIRANDYENSRKYLQSSFQHKMRVDAILVFILTIGNGVGYKIFKSLL